MRAWATHQQLTHASRLHAWHFCCLTQLLLAHLLLQGPTLVPHRTRLQQSVNQLLQGPAHVPVTPQWSATIGGSQAECVPPRVACHSLSRGSRCGC